jgi:hypothetical protein
MLLCEMLHAHRHRHRHSPKAEKEDPQKDQGREKIEWHGEDRRDRKRSTDRDKRPRESPGRTERRHTSRHDKVGTLLYGIKTLQGT